MGSILLKAMHKNFRTSKQDFIQKHIHFKLQRDAAKLSDEVGLFEDFGDPGLC